MEGSDAREAWRARVDNARWLLRRLSVAFAILTDEPNELVASYHDRMPLALADDQIDKWLDLSNESPVDDNLLLALDEFTVRPWNNVKQKDLATIDPEAKAA